jgi:hypothetical protein
MKNWRCNKYTTLSLLVYFAALWKKSTSEERCEQWFLTTGALVCHKGTLPDGGVYHRNMDGFY